MSPSEFGTLHFNSRTSCEVRRMQDQHVPASLHFNSRTSCEVRRRSQRKFFSAASISTHAPLARCDGNEKCCAGNSEFQLTHLLRGATAHHFRSSTHLFHFNSRTSCEVRPNQQHIDAGRGNFNSRTSCEVRQKPGRGIGRGDISTHAPLARCDETAFPSARSQSISTHAPLARCDKFGPGRTTRPGISTHAPLARCDHGQCGTGGRGNGFQLTHLLRGATMASKLGDWIFPISTHAPLARCD